MVPLNRRIPNIGQKMCLYYKGGMFLLGRKMFNRDEKCVHKGKIVFIREKNLFIRRKN